MILASEYRIRDVSEIPKLIRLLRDEGPHVRRSALLLLSSAGPEAEAAINPILSLIDNSDQETRRVVVEALGNILAEPEERAWYDPVIIHRSRKRKVVRALITAIDDEAEEVRRAAVIALEAIGCAAKDAIPALCRALKDPLTADVSAHALGTVGKGSTLAVAALREALNSQMALNSEVAYHAAYALGKLRSDAREALPELVEALRKGKRDSVRYAAADCLPRIGANPSDIVPPLVEALESKDSQLRHRAIEALGEIGLPAQAAIPALLNRLKNREDCHEVVKALGSFGSEAAPSIPAIVDILKDSRSWDTLRSSAAETLGNIGSAASEAVPVLLDLVDDNWVGYSAIVALGGIGAATGEVVPKLLEILESKSPEHIRRETVYALGKMGLPKIQLEDILSGYRNDSALQVREAVSKVLA